MKLSRRDFMKANAVAEPLPWPESVPPPWRLTLLPAPTRLPSPGTRRRAASAAPAAACWSALRQDVRVATQGDPEAPVNRGLNCVKGYFLSKIMYGDDRLNQPLLRMKNGVYDKQGEFQPVSWEQAFDIMDEQDQGGAARAWPRGRRHVRFRAMDGVGRLRRQQADEGRFPHQQHRPQRRATAWLPR